VNRFFVEDVSIDRIALPAAVAHQVSRVLRLRDGDEIMLLDNAGQQARCRLSGSACEVVERGDARGEPRHRLSICQALIKGDRLEEVVQHGTEIGVAEFRLFVSERCVVRELSDRRIERLRTIAREAAEQSERGRVPAVCEPVPFDEVAAPGAVLLFERHAGARLSQLEQPAASLIIGPEGGFSPAEVATARERGVVLASLGPRILRSESVALAAAAVVLSGSGDFA
jgi:16S rRNA (uracil1498-N3)-methyltransferase